MINDNVTRPNFNAELDFCTVKECYTVHCMLMMFYTQHRHSCNYDPKEPDGV